MKGDAAVRLAERIIRPRNPSSRAGSNLYIAHGLLGNSNNWSTAASRLVNHSSISHLVRGAHTLDMRNHGDSPHTGNHTNAGLASDLEAAVLRGQQELVRDPQLPSVDAVSTTSILIGHSMGGFAVMGSLLRRYNESALLVDEERLAYLPEGGAALFGGCDPKRREACSAAMRLVNEQFGFGETQPIRDVLFKDPSAPQLDTSVAVGRRLPTFGRVSASVIVDVTPTMRLGEQQRPGGDSVKRVLDCMTRVELNRIHNYDDAREELKRVGIQDQGMRDFVGTNLVLKDGQQAAWKCNLPVLQADYGGFLPSIVPWIANAAGSGAARTSAPQPCTLPVLFVFGSESPYNEDEHRSQIATFFPNATQVVVAGAGHFVHYEKPQEFVEITASFIAPYL